MVKEKKERNKDRVIASKNDAKSNITIRKFKFYRLNLKNDSKLTQMTQRENGRKNKESDEGDKILRQKVTHILKREMVENTKREMNCVKSLR